jgi:hypothetical protein
MIPVILPLADIPKSILTLRSEMTESFVHLPEGKDGGFLPLIELDEIQRWMY